MGGVKLDEIPLVYFASRVGRRSSWGFRNNGIVLIFAVLTSWSDCGH